VRTTLEPILKQLSEKPRPEEIINLKVCDPAMGFRPTDKAYSAAKRAREYSALAPRQ